MVTLVTRATPGTPASEYINGYMDRSIDIQHHGYIKSAIKNPLIKYICNLLYYTNVMVMIRIGHVHHDTNRP